MSTRSGSSTTQLKDKAFQIAAQLPQDRQEAMQVLEYLRELVDWRGEDSPGPEVAALHAIK